MKKQKVTKNVKEKGITLVALIITIVVMLTLAGVTINLTLGQNGIFTTAQKASQNYRQAQNQEMVGINDFTSTIDKVVESVQNNYEIAGTVIKTENGVNYTADGAGNTIPVPVGFSPITTSDQGTRNTGFVIKNDTDGNEFVWVPVHGMNYSYNRYALRTGQPEDGLDEDTQSVRIKVSEGYYTEKLAEDEAISVSKYGGYYIGRYETGIKNGTLTDSGENGVSTNYQTLWTGYTGGSVIIQKEQQVWDYITRDKAKQVSENLYNKENDNIKSKLCSSYAWDTALKFIETQNSSYPNNSRGGNYARGYGGTGEQQKTGYDTAHPCNIYDMGGNVYEITTEAFSAVQKYTIRGGMFRNRSDWAGASFRSMLGVAGASDQCGFRIALYIE